MESGPGKDPADHIQEAVHVHWQCEESAAAAANAPSAAAAERGADVSSPTPPPAPPVERSQEWAREQPGDGGAATEGSIPAAAEVDRKGKKVAAIPSMTPSTPSSASSNTSSPFAADAAASAAGTSSSAVDSAKRVTWRHPVVTGMTMVPNLARRRYECDEVRKCLEREQAAIKDLEARWAEAEEEEEEEEEQVMAKVKLWSKVRDYSKNKVNPPQAKVTLWPEKKKPLWSKVKDDLKNKFLDIKGRRICFSNQNSMESLSPKSPPHVDYQTIPMAEASNHYSDNLGQGAVPSNVQDLSHAYSEIRPVKGEGECFYRSFIFSYLEQVLDRQDTDEERRLLAAVKRVAVQHANLRWTSEWSRSHKAFKKLIKKVMRWKRQGRWNGVPSTNSYRKQKLLEFFSTYDTTNDIFVFLRLVTAIWICSHRDDYEHLIPELRGYLSLEDWCFQKVTPRCDTDHVEIMAFTSALEVPLRVEHLIQGPAQDIYTCHGVPRVTLLFTGNHYDIIYPFPPCAESSIQQTAQGESPDESSRQKVLQGES